VQCAHIMPTGNNMQLLFSLNSYYYKFADPYYCEVDYKAALFD